MAVIQTYRDGRYAWRCEDCGSPRLEMAHRGPRKSVCKACQEGAITGPEQRCFPFCTRPGLRKGRAGSSPAGIAAPTGIVPPVRSRHGRPCRVRSL